MIRHFYVFAKESGDLRLPKKCQTRQSSLRGLFSAIKCIEEIGITDNIAINKLYRWHIDLLILTLVNKCVGKILTKILRYFFLTPVTFAICEYFLYVHMYFQNPGSIKYNCRPGQRHQKRLPIALTSKNIIMNFIHREMQELKSYLQEYTCIQKHTQTYRCMYVSISPHTSQKQMPNRKPKSFQWKE